MLCSDRLISSEGGVLEKRFTRCSSSSSSEWYLWLNNQVWCGVLVYVVNVFPKNVVVKHMYKAL